ncbi:hypothetical protein V6N13_083126 [Hibiscus sabdariffa]
MDPHSLEKFALNFSGIKLEDSNGKQYDFTRSPLEKEKLNGINFLDWFRNLRIVLKQERKEYVIEETVPNNPGANAPRNMSYACHHDSRALEATRGHGCIRDDSES